MIAVRIPEEIRLYKEKMVFGLTWRQLISTIISVMVCVPLYLFAGTAIPSELVSWIIIFIALPIVSFGYFRFNGMAFEKFIVVVIKKEFLFPKKRYYKTENAFREWQNKEIQVDKSKDRRTKKQKYQDSLERTLAMIKEEEVLTVRNKNNTCKNNGGDFGGDKREKKQQGKKNSKKH